MRRYNKWNELFFDPKHKDIIRSLSIRERDLCEQFIVANDSTKDEYFESRINRWIAEIPRKPKRINEMKQLLLSTGKGELK